MGHRAAHTSESNLSIDMTLGLVDCDGNLVFGDDGLGCLPPCTEMAADWRGSSCDSCTNAPQTDQLQCSDILDCYLENGCGPEDCGNNDDVCGVNTLKAGGGAKQRADQVYRCMCNTVI